MIIIDIAGTYEAMPFVFKLFFWVIIFSICIRKIPKIPKIFKVKGDK